MTGDTQTLPANIPAGGINCTTGNAVPANPGVPDINSGIGTAAVLFRQSKFAPLPSSNTFGRQQGMYLNENVTDLANLTVSLGDN